ncbi:MAG: 3-hydroxy-3-methylglutaryl-CoA reductase, partial [Candidatus Hydrothermarchaeota archaeon]
MKTSKISGFYKLSIEERLKIVKEFANLSDEEVEILKNTGCMKIEQVDRMIENVIGAIEVPLGIAVNFRINNKDYLIPMAIEEPSVVAAASYAAKLARPKGGFFAECDSSLMIGQIQLTNIENPYFTKMVILSEKENILKIANAQDKILVKLGGGAKDLEVRVIDTIKGKMLVVHLIVDCLDAMGANA